MKKLNIYIVIFLLIGVQLYADLDSISGNINFDSDNNGITEVTINADGLGISISAPSANLHVSGNSIITNNLSIGSSTSSNSTLNIYGTLGFSVETISDNTTLSGNSNILVGSSNGEITSTLPNSASVLGRLYSIKKIISTNDVVIQGGGNIDMSTNIILSSGNLGFLKVISSGTQIWSILSVSGNVN